MKDVILTILSIFLCVVIVYSCMKDDLNDASNIGGSTSEIIDTLSNKTIATSTTSAKKDAIFYRGSATVDNYLDDLKPRTHIVFNKYIIDTIKFSKGLYENVNISGVDHRHYKILITFKDGFLPEEFTAYSKDTLPEFTMVPTGNNLLKDSNSHFIKYIKDKNVKVTYNEWRGQYYNLWEWRLYKDYEEIGLRYKEPLNKNSIQFTPPHSF